MPDRSRIIPYFRVSTSEQGESGAGLAAQNAKVTAEQRARGWEVVAAYTDVASGKSMRKRPELARALASLEAGEADLLVVAKLDRLSRSMLDFAGMVALSQEQGWGIVALDLGVDTSTPNGKLVANIIMALAEWERELIGQRTKDALGAVKASGKKLGRPSNRIPEAEAIIRTLVAEGVSLRGIAKRLNDQDIRTSQGGQWHASTVRLVLSREPETSVAGRSTVEPNHLGGKS